MSKDSIRKARKGSSLIAEQPTLAGNKKKSKGLDLDALKICTWMQFSTTDSELSL
jgi:hypothetical protein